jgi:MoxR-like ATPase
VLATQNPIEQEGTYPLPEAQLDRFLLEVDVDYPTLEAERRIMLATTGAEDAVSETVMNAETLQQVQQLVRRMPAGETVVEAILSIVRSARPNEPGAYDFVARNVAWGPGPRAAQALMMCARAKALIDGRLAPSVADVEELARPALKHRMALTFAAKAEGGVVDEVIDAIAERALQSAAAA